MHRKRFWIAVAIIVVLIVLGFVLSVPHAHDSSKPPEETASASTTPAVTLADAYKKGVHTLSGSVMAPDACAIVTPYVSTTTVSTDTGSTTVGIVLSLQMPPDADLCLQLPTPAPFSATIAASADAPISVIVNGAPATTTAP